MDLDEEIKRKGIRSYFVESRIDVDDSFAVMARRNLDFFRDKFDRLLIQK